MVICAARFFFQYIVNMSFDILQHYDFLSPYHLFNETSIVSLEISLPILDHVAIAAVLLCRYP